MINIFKKKPKECKHKYKDFPWYVSHRKDIYPTYCVEIIEPYVCLLCKKRIDKVLSFVSGVYGEEIDDVKKDLKKKYKDKIEERAVVEDMVNDCQLVDKSFLESYEYSQKVTEDIMKSMHEQTPGSQCSVSEATTILSKSYPENQVEENKSGSNNKELLKLISDMKETFSKNADTAPDPRRLLELHNAQREKCTSNAGITIREPSTYLM